MSAALTPQHYQNQSTVLLPLQQDDMHAFLVRGNPAYLEAFIVARLFRDRAFFTSAISVLNRTGEGYPVKDFLVPANMALYMCANWYHHNTNGAFSETPNPALIQFCLEHLAQQGDYMAPSMIPSTIDVFMHLFTYDLQVVRQVVSDHLTGWLYDKRNAYYQSMVEKGVMSTRQAVEATNAEMVRIERCFASHRTMFNFAEAIRNPPPKPRQLKTGLLGMDKALEGGPGYGEGNLVISPNGGGKTVIATQLTGQTVMLNPTEGALLISTEQAHNMLANRMVASMCGILFNKVNRGVDFSQLSKSQVVSYDRVENALQRRMRFVNWQQAWGRSSLKTKLEDLVKEAEDDMQLRVSLLTFDWLGRAIGDTGGKDDLRIIYKNKADEFFDFVKEKNIVGYAMAQASNALALNKMQVDATCIAECKSLGDNATNIFGVTALYKDKKELEAEMKTNDKPADLFSARQFLFGSKMRLSAGAYVPVWRNFAYQRFDDSDPMGSNRYSPPSADDPQD